LNQKPRRRSLGKVELGQPLELRPNRTPVQTTIALRPWGPDRRSLRTVEHPELDPRQIRGPAHNPAQRIDFPHHGPLGDPSDRGIAGHLADGLEVLGEQERPRPGPRRHRAGLGAGMPSPDNDHVEAIHPGKLRAVGGVEK
jgi:hypothetical protein